jgi:hypothetical protein
MGGWFCYLQLLLVLASAVILGPKSRGTHDHILLSQIRDSPNLEGQVLVFISPRNRVAHSSELYLNMQFLPHRKHCISVTKTNWLMLCKEIIAVYFENLNETSMYTTWATCSLPNVKADGTYTNHCVSKG